jgi:hypothetical protein
MARTLSWDLKVSREWICKGDRHEISCGNHRYGQFAALTACTADDRHSNWSESTVPASPGGIDRRTSPSFELTSTAFAHMESRFLRNTTCDGEDVSPPLTWGEAPIGDAIPGAHHGRPGCARRHVGPLAPVQHPARQARAAGRPALSPEKMSIRMRFTSAIIPGDVRIMAAHARPLERTATSSSCTRSPQPSTCSPARRSKSC